MLEILRGLQESEPSQRPPEPLIKPPSLFQGIVASTIAELTNPKVPDTADPFGDPEVTDHRLRTGVNLLGLLANKRFYEGGYRPAPGELDLMSYEAPFLSRAFQTCEGGRLTILGRRLETPSRAFDMPVRQWAFAYQSQSPSGRPNVHGIQARLKAEQGMAECPSPQDRHYRIEDWTFDYYDAPMLVEEFRPGPRGTHEVAQLLGQLQHAVAIDDRPAFAAPTTAGHMFAWQSL